MEFPNLGSHERYDLEVFRTDSGHDSVQDITYESVPYKNLNLLVKLTLPSKKEVGILKDRIEIKFESKKPITKYISLRLEKPWV